MVPEFEFQKGIEQFRQIQPVSPALPQQPIQPEPFSYIGESGLFEKQTLIPTDPAGRPVTQEERVIGLEKIERQFPEPEFVGAPEPAKFKKKTFSGLLRASIPFSKEAVEPLLAGQKFSVEKLGEFEAIPSQIQFKGITLAERAKEQTEKLKVGAEEALEERKFGKFVGKSVGASIAEFGTFALEKPITAGVVATGFGAAPAAFQVGGALGLETVAVVSEPTLAAKTRRLVGDVGTFGITGFATKAVRPKKALAEAVVKKAVKETPKDIEFEQITKLKEFRAKVPTEKTLLREGLEITRSGEPSQIITRFQEVPTDITTVKAPGLKGIITPEKQVLTQQVTKFGIPFEVRTITRKGVSEIDVLRKGKPVTKKPLEVEAGTFEEFKFKEPKLEFEKKKKIKKDESLKEQLLKIETVESIPQKLNGKKQREAISIIKQEELLKAKVEKPEIRTVTTGFEIGEAGELQPITTLDIQTPKLEFVKVKPEPAKAFIKKTPEGVITKEPALIASTQIGQISLRTKVVTKKIPRQPKIKKPKKEALLEPSEFTKEIKENILFQEELAKQKSLGLLRELEPLPVKTKPQVTKVKVKEVVKKVPKIDVSKEITPKPFKFAETTLPKPKTVPGKFLPAETLTGKKISLKDATDLAQRDFQKFKLGEKLIQRPKTEIQKLTEFKLDDEFKLPEEKIVTREAVLPQPVKPKPQIPTEKVTTKIFQEQIKEPEQEITPQPRPPEPRPPTPRPREVVIEKKVPKKIPKVKLKPKKKLKLGEVTYDTFVGSGKKEKRINKNPLTKKAALAVGDNRVSNTLAATFSVKKSKLKGQVLDTTKQFNRKNYRDYRIKKGKKIKLENKYIEKRKYRLSSAGEKAQIRGSKRRMKL
jgi:hypothetical protein